MIGTRTLPESYALWNKIWKAPNGSKVYRAYEQLCERSRYFPECKGRGGVFTAQKNSIIRTWEYPWAFHSVPLEAGMKILELGGGLCGFQFVLSKMGMDVTNVDPGEESEGLGWPVTGESMARLNARFRTNVRLVNTTIEAAGIESETIARVFCLSVMEHIPQSEHKHILSEVYRLLQPGGYLVLTVDLFLDLHPFTDRKSNKWGTNVSVADLLGAAPFELHIGDTAELNGFTEFEPRRILSELPRYIVGEYPALAQCAVFRKPG